MSGSGLALSKHFFFCCFLAKTANLVTWVAGGVWMEGRRKKKCAYGRLRKLTERAIKIAVCGGTEEGAFLFDVLHKPSYECGR